MKLYELSDNGPYSRGYPYASGYGPLDNSMPFLSGRMRDSMFEFWKKNPMKPGLYIDEKGTKWGDLIAVHLPPPALLVSERVRVCLEKVRCRIETCTEFPVAEIRAKKLRSVPPPRYFALQLRGGVAVHWRAMGIELDSLGKPVIVPGKQPPLVADLTTWNRDDIFSWSNWDPLQISLLCTERVVELAEKEKWTNVRFDPVLTS